MTKALVTGAVGSAARGQTDFESFNEITEPHGSELVETENINGKEGSNLLTDLGPHICIRPAWHHVAKPSAPEIPTKRFAELHLRDLPRGRVGAPISWSTIHGEDEISVSLLQYTLRVEAGEITAEDSVTVEERDDVTTVINKLVVAPCDALCAVGQEPLGGIVDAASYPHEEDTCHPRRQPQDGIVNRDSAFDIRCPRKGG